MDLAICAKRDSRETDPRKRDLTIPIPRVILSDNGRAYGSRESRDARTRFPRMRRWIIKVPLKSTLVRARCLSSATLVGKRKEERTRDSYALNGKWYERGEEEKEEEEEGVPG